MGKHRATRRSFQLLFHDTHHRSVTAPKTLATYDLQHYDGVLAFGQIIRDIYLEQGWAARAWTWHEAADVDLFRPLPDFTPTRDLIWIGNWGDEERSEELREYLLRPVQQLRLKATAHGVRYPQSGKHALRQAGIEYRGWLANFHVSAVFAQHRATVHVPRRAYRQALHGIPTIRVFEALACGIPLVSVAWTDSEQLFRPGNDFLVARSGTEMQEHLRTLLNDPAAAGEFRRHGLHTIQSRHTCSHRVDELLSICRQLDVPSQHEMQPAINHASSVSVSQFKG
jgi:spore maturation protein CgeB